MSILRIEMRRMWQRVAAAAFLALVGLPTFAAAQLPDSATTSTSSRSTTTTTTWTSEELISDWRLWAVLGAVLLVILVIAMTRGKGDSTTIVK